MRYLASKTGVVHVVNPRRSEQGSTPCPVVARNLNAGTWKGQRSLNPREVLEGYKDCTKCETFKHARLDIKVPPKQRTEKKGPPAPKSLRRAVNDAVELNDKLAKLPANNKPRNVTKLLKGDNWPVADERTTQKAKEHVALAEQHGWTVQVTSNDRRGLTVIASRGDEICVLAYRENGILWNDEIVFKVPGRKVPMHNSGTWRRQVSLPEGQRPIPARPKKFGRKAAVKNTVAVENANEAIDEGSVSEEELIPINKSSLPFPHDADDIVIIDHIRGRTLYWRNNMMAKVVSAQVPTKPRMIRFGHTGRAQRRYVSFPESTMTADGEVYGAERSVAIEDMLRVR